jgi:alkane 1-monooxygenase
MYIWNSIWHYAKYFLAAWIMLFSLPLFILGGSALMWYGIAAIAFIALGDVFFGEDLTEYEGSYRYPGLFFWLETLSQIIMIVTTILFAWLIGLPERDLFHIGAGIQAWTGFDAIAEHAQGDSVGFWISAFAITSFGGALVNVAIAHNMIHRTYDAKSVWIGRIGEAFGMFTYFSIRHPYGHHNLVGTPADPAWGRRGENWYHFFLRSVIGQYKMTWDLEKRRLRKMRKSSWNPSNAALQGWLLEVLVAMLFFYAAGWMGLIAFLGIGIVTHAALELANYIEHYGLVRSPETPFQYRHAWNDNHRLSLWLIAAVPRHAHHHADAQVEHYELKALPYQAPATLGGYIVSAVAAFIPPLWQYLMTPRLLAWDATFANDTERELAAIENMRSGVPLLMEAGERYFMQRGRPLPKIAAGQKVDGLPLADIA